MPINEYIQEKINVLQRILNNEQCEPRFSKHLLEVISEYLAESYNRGVEDSIQTLKNNYGSDGKPALVIIENFEGFNEQRPALEETIDNISKLKTNK